MEEATASRLLEAVEALGPAVNAALENPPGESHLALVFTDKWNLAIHDGFSWMRDEVCFTWFNEIDETQEINYEYDLSDHSVCFQKETKTKRFENGRVFFCLNTDVVATMILLIRNKQSVNKLIGTLTKLPQNLEFIDFTVAVHQMWAFAEAISDGDHAIKSRVFRFLY